MQQVQIKPGYTNVSIGHKLASAGDVVTLSDAEYLALDPALFDVVFTDLGTVNTNDPAQSLRSVSEGHVLTGRWQRAAADPHQFINAKPASAKPRILAECWDKAGVIHSVWQAINMFQTDNSANSYYNEEPFDEWGRIRIFINDDLLPAIDMPVNHFYKSGRRGGKFSSTRVSKPRMSDFTTTFEAGWVRELSIPFTRYMRVEYENAAGSVRVDHQVLGSSSAAAVQALRLSPKVTGGTFKIGYVNPSTRVTSWTSTIAYNASQATIQTALRALDSDLSACVVGGAATLNAGIITVTFTGTTGFKPLLKINGSALTGAGGWLGGSVPTSAQELNTYCEVDYSVGVDVAALPLRGYREFCVIDHAIARHSAWTICDFAGAGQLDHVYLNYHLPSGSLVFYNEEGDVEVLVDGETMYGGFGSSAFEDFFKAAYNDFSTPGASNTFAVPAAAASSLDYIGGTAASAAWQKNLAAVRWFDRGAPRFETGIKVRANIGERGYGAMEGATIRMAATVGLWLDDVLPVNYKSPLTGTTLSAPALTSLPTGYTRSGTEMAVSGGVAAVTDYGDNRWLHASTAVGADDYAVQVDMRFRHSRNMALTNQIQAADGAGTRLYVTLPATHRGVYAGENIQIGGSIDYTPQVVVANGTQSAATIASNGYITVNSFTPAQTYAAGTVVVPQDYSEVVALTIRSETDGDGGYLPKVDAVSLKRVGDYGAYFEVSAAGNYGVSKTPLAGNIDWTDQWITVLVIVDGGSTEARWARAYWKPYGVDGWQGIGAWRPTNGAGQPAVAAWKSNCEFRNFQVRDLAAVTT
jgi:hypothetical protein